MKKIIIIHCAKGYGGSTISLLDMIDMLRKDYDISVYISVKADRRIKECLIESEVAMIEYNKEPWILAHYSGINAPIKLGFWIGLLRFINNEWWIRTISKERADIVLLNSSVLSCLGAALKKNGFRVICYNRETHNMNYHGILNNFMRFKLNKMDHVIFLSEIEKKHFHLDTNCSTVSDAFNQTIITKPIKKKDARQILGLEQDTFYLLFLGGISKLKGTLTILKAMELLRTNYNIKLLILGDLESSAAGYYSQKCKSMMHDNIQVYGLQKSAGLFYSAADAVVFPSSLPHQARPIYEAGFYSLPVIISDFEATKEEVIDGFNGLVFEPKNSIELRNAILRLYDNYDMRKNIGINNNELSNKLHSMENSKKRLILIIESIVN